jgi:hypothetical protein
MRRGTDSMNVAAYQMGDAGVLQARHHRPGRGGKPPGDPGANGFDETSFELRQRYIAACGDECADDDQQSE